MQSDTAMRNKNGGLNQQVIARRSHPAQNGEGFDAPPTIKRSGSEHRRAVTSPLPEEEGLGEKVELPLAKGRRRDSKKTPHLFSDEEHFLEMEVDFLQPFLDIEARTALANPGEVAMA